MRIITLLALMTFSFIATACDKCEKWYSYEYRAEVGVYDFYEVEMCDKYDVNFDGEFDLKDLAWIVDRVRYHYTVPLHKDAVGDFDESGSLSAADVCELFEEGQDEGFIPEGECFISEPAP